MRRALALGCLLVFLGGCATTSRPPTEAGDRAAWQARRANLLALSGWTMQARAGSGGLFGWSGNLRWVQLGDRFDISVSGPLGAGAMRIVGTPERLRIRKDGKTYVTSQPDAFFRQQLKLTFPVAGLRYWALGVPEPGVPASVAVDAQGRVTQISQSGWTLTYDDYRQVGEYQLPGRLSGVKDDTRIKLVVHEWTNVH